MGKLGDDNSELSGSWCWIKGTDEIDKILWSLISGKGWEIFTYVFTTSLYILLKGFTIRKRKREPDFDWSKITKNLRKEDENFCMAFMILYIARLWGTIRFFLVVFGVKNNSIDRILIYLHSYGDSAQAFWNCILYCLCDKTVLRFVFPSSSAQKQKLINNTAFIKASYYIEAGSVMSYRERATSLNMCSNNEKSALLKKIRTTV